MSFQIRRADTEDVKAVAAVLQASELDDNPDMTRIARVIPHHETWVVVENDRILGFVDSFMTVSAQGVRRFEVDLLGVLPAWQGRGIARRLVAEAVRAAPEHQLTRALIRSTNIASQRCFAASGFEAGGVPLYLYAASAHSETDSDNPTSTDFVEVETLTYSGLWLEGEITTDGLRKARRMLHHNQWDTAGVLIPQTSIEAQALAEQAGYEKIGTYEWWLLKGTLA